MEGQRRLPTVTSAAVSKVLDNDDLLMEILLRVGFPTSLVRVALVCKRWHHHASDTEFLSRFREQHPPRLLGFYINDGSRLRNPHFIPMLPQPPELAAVIRRTNFDLDTSQRIRGCQNGRVFTTHHEVSGLKHAVYSPLLSERHITIAPPSSSYKPQDCYFSHFSDIISVEEGDGLSYLYVLVESNSKRTKSMVQVHMLRPGDGIWRTHLTLAADQLSDIWDSKVVLIDNKIYMPCFLGDIIILDLTSSILSTIQLPQGVEYGYRVTMLSWTNDASAVCLIHAKDLRLHIWLYKGDNWLMVDTICLRKNLRMSDHMFDAEIVGSVRIIQVGDCAEFVLLEIGDCIFHFDIKCKTLRKVYENANKNHYIRDIHAFMMTWPRTFSALKNDAT